jgi:hypothetical protein
MGPARLGTKILLDDLFRFLVAIRVVLQHHGRRRWSKLIVCDFRLWSSPHTEKQVITFHNRLRLRRPSTEREDGEENGSDTCNARSCGAPGRLLVELHGENRC